MAVKIQLRRDTAANWTSANPTLSSGEPGYETDTGAMKIGDGSTAWNSLAYFSAGGGSGGPAIAAVYANTAAMIAAQGGQDQNALYLVSDASSDATVDSGWAVYQYLGTTVGDLTDYRKLSEQESLEVFGGAPVSSTGTAIQFDRPRNYGVSTPETGNITLNSTGLVAGNTQLVIHNNSGAPTFGAEFTVVSGTYVTDEDNYIMLHAVSASLILVTINQEV